MNWAQDIPILQNIVLPVLDVLLLAFIFYRGYQILVQTRAVQLFKGALFMFLMYVIAFVLNLRTLLRILNLVAPSVVIGLAIIFQPELRNIFTRIGLGHLLPFGGGTKRFDLDAAITAITKLSAVGRGALLVFVRSVGLKNIIETGTRLDAQLSTPLLLSIFAYDTALHDGAVIIGDGKIVAAGCFLPLSEQVDVRRSFGTRHRAALGLAEESDAIVVVVSEESSAISMAYNTNLYYDLSPLEIRRRMIEMFNLEEEAQLSKAEGFG